MQEHVLHIKLVDRVGTGDDQGKHHADGGRLDHRAEALIVINAGPLGEAVKDLTSLVPLQGAVGVELVLKDPFIGDDVGANRTRDKIPSVVGDQSIIFFFHGTMSEQVGEGGTNGDGHQIEWRRRGGRQHVGSQKPRFACVVIR
jgi:hypothetical protein